MGNSRDNICVNNFQKLKNKYDRLKKKIIRLLNLKNLFERNVLNRISHNEDDDNRQEP